jgi:hypothetical protein
VTVDKMTVDKMTVDKMACCQNKAGMRFEIFDILFLKKEFVLLLLPIFCIILLNQQIDQPNV